MILTCPSCSTRYLVDPAALGETGRTVRCARCGESWNQAPPDDMPKRVDVSVAPERVRPIPPGSNLPALPSKKRSHAWMGWAALIVVMVGVAAGAVLAREQVVAVWPDAARFYALVGLTEEPAGQPFELRDVKQSTFVENDKTVVVVTGKIVNVSSRRLAVPRVVARVYDREAKVLDEWQFSPVRTELGPREETEFSDRFTDPPKGAVNLVVSLAPEG